MTRATTVIVKDKTDNTHAVYIAGRHSYDVTNRDERFQAFLQDINENRISSVRNARERYPLLHDPLVPIEIFFGVTEVDKKRFYVKFEPPIRFTGVWTPEKKMIVHARIDLGVIVTTPWDEDSWDRETLYQRISDALARSWRRHVMEDGQSDHDVKTALLAAGTADVSFNQTKSYDKR